MEKLTLTKWECGIIHSAIGIVPAASINDIEILLRSRSKFKTADTDSDEIDIDISKEDMSIVLSNIVNPQIQYPVNENTVLLFDKLKNYIK